MSLAIARARERIGQIYAFDLVGAALGCLFVIPTASAFGGPGALIVAAAPAPCPRRCSRSLRRHSRHAPRAWALGSLSLLVGGAAVRPWRRETGAHRFGVARNPDKFLGDRPVQFEKWNSFSQITVAPASAPDHRWIFIDADAATRLWSGAIARRRLRGPAPLPRGAGRVAGLCPAPRRHRADHRSGRRHRRDLGLAPRRAAGGRASRSTPSSSTTSSRASTPGSPAICTATRASTWWSTRAAATSAARTSRLRLDPGDPGRHLGGVVVGRVHAVRKQHLHRRGVHRVPGAPGARRASSRSPAGTTPASPRNSCA